MATKDPRVDAYIEKAAEFARPILKHIRKLVHTACPKVTETMKWNCPHFEYKGVLCGTAAFKQHCMLTFWKGKLIFANKEAPKGGTAMGHFGRITSLSDLPGDKTMIGYLKEAVRLNEEGVKAPARSKPGAKKLVVPDDLSAALKKDKKALTTFENFSYTNKREYVEWITEAKREETRKQRLATTLAWLAEGKDKNWKYRIC
jgi:uncharacterized protein YdeI (YjbR/CyaY-like superfamily)